MTEGTRTPWALWLILASVLLAILSLRSWVFAVLVQPVALLIWAAWRVVAGVDQHICWTLMIAAYFLLALRLLLPRGEPRRLSAYRPESVPVGRIEYWRRLKDEAHEGREGRDRLDQSLRTLLRSIRAFDERAEAVAGEMEEEPWASLPLQARLILGLNAQGDEVGHRRQQLDILAMIPRWMRRKGVWPRRDDDGWIDETLTWMETQLDIRHADRNEDRPNI